MFRSNAVPVALATVCGVLTAVTVWQPELQKNEIERQGEITFPRPSAAQQQESDTAISRAIKEDIKEAAEQLKAGGFAWGIRKMIWPDKPTEEDKRSGPSADVK